jgi:hypothetical protein
MQTVTKKSVVESPPSKPPTAEMPDIDSLPVSDRLAAFRGNPERGLTDTQVDTRQAARRAVTAARLVRIAE